MYTTLLSINLVRLDAYKFLYTMFTVLFFHAVLISIHLHDVDQCLCNGECAEVYSHLINSHIVNSHFVNVSIPTLSTLTKSELTKWVIDKVGNLLLKSWRLKYAWNEKLTNWNWQNGNWRCGSWPNGKTPYYAYVTVRAVYSNLERMAACMHVYVMRARFLIHAI